MSKFEIPLDQAAKEFYEIEGRYLALCQLTRLPDGMRKRIRDAAAYVRHLAILTEKEAKKR
ncbi:hypothetical protein [Corynebacterium minutissimum]|uniref:Uncharacterized protein n=1 Tax=Corynebacterium minutissimum TaxID=38301 RepID=A0A376CVW8_9CORY|nr:hypothetical protein [Corynebacterium minutissimum]QRP60569.1 hypothetical protein I6J26_10475 [Corynebacterium minutissimum]STC76343.1 Uncharacterised protein [Corynebacterium minutissimum]